MSIELNALKSIAALSTDEGARNVAREALAKIKALSFSTPSGEAEGVDRTVECLQWVLHRFLKTEYDKDILKWKWNQTLWSSQDMYERFLQENDYPYQGDKSLPPVQEGEAVEADELWDEFCESSDPKIRGSSLDGDFVILKEEFNKMVHKYKITRK